MRVTLSWLNSKAGEGRVGCLMCDSGDTCVSFFSFRKVPNTHTYIYATMYFQEEYVYIYTHIHTLLYTHMYTHKYVNIYLQKWLRWAVRIHKGRHWWELTAIDISPLKQETHPSVIKIRHHRNTDGNSNNKQVMQTVCHTEAAEQKAYGIFTEPETVWEKGVFMSSWGTLGLKNKSQLFDCGSMGSPGSLEHWGAGSIPDLSHGVKDLALQLWHKRQLRLGSQPWPGNS